MSKRYELMNKEEIIGFFSSSWDNDTIKSYLNEEIKTKKVHRYELLKSPEDFETRQLEFEHHCCMSWDDCMTCKYNRCGLRKGNCYLCFINFLKEEIEVEDETI